ncbi:recombinase family protein [Actinomycetaceae bacterium WB03_NA08]|uniref:Recombinase family protein n=2 Tax=Scrofimicrobium canadense TaxID=2652290 RepID=A0A6N7WB72_9ACTO|nr:recombinase family protein [Scrofimicrobium canadense]
MSAARAGGIDLILTKSISRFARNTVILLETVRELKDLGVEVRFEREQISSLTGDGELMLSILASFAQEEAWSTSANVKWGIRKNFERGITNQMCVYGYTWTGSEFLINEVQAEAVRFIYKRFLEGAIYADIIRECEAAGYEAYWGGMFTTAALKMILRQERYTGNTLLGKSFNPYPGHHGMKNTGQAPMYFAEGTNPQIIDQETFDAAQTALAKRTAANAHPRSPRTVFSGHIWCGPCQVRANRAVARWQGKKMPLWQCPLRGRGKPAVCMGGSVPEPRLEEITCLIASKPEFTTGLFEQTVVKVVIWSPTKVRFHLRGGKVFEVEFTKGRYAKPLTAEDLMEVKP